MPAFTAVCAVVIDLVRLNGTSRGTLCIGPSHDGHVERNAKNLWFDIECFMYLSMLFKIETNGLGYIHQTRHDIHGSILTCKRYDDSWSEYDFVHNHVYVDDMYRLADTV